MSEKQLPIWLWLTSEEFLVTYAYQLVAWWHPAYFGEEMSEDQRDLFFEDLNRGMMAAAADLIERDFRYTAIGVNHVGEIVRMQDEPIEMGNMLFLLRKSMGRLAASPVIACETALRAIEDRALSIDRAPIQAVLDQCRRDSLASQAEAERDPENLQEMMKWFDTNRTEATQAILAAMGRTN